ncbi:uncharacterized protein A1O9_03612 [Exophiala aquamarina CBS 119918]|uniref:NADP-dependent oxidoreductase domain-containing protein n=1 Tax=Exophiala aquamarina CBS 119918 TaxID=1182545 RepID=A0A072PFB6_9EURO|nr:uncharacterized protein A1O9_03612 [Exophiala aquamarina CBS 119918]KEF58769.1 hypothetical protein A1O9_03612 [Exophiala aquamarina CBS 119918]
MASTPAPPPKTRLGHHRVLGPNCSLKVSPLCLGAMNFGDIWSVLTSITGACTRETTYAILDEFHDAGGNFIDTANMYMAGESEEWLGDWMVARGVRDEMVIATKYTYTYKIHELCPPGTITSNFGGSNKKSLRLSLTESLKRLKTDYLDILYVHNWDGVATIPEMMRALDDVVKQGKVLYLGVSNWPAWLVVKANDYARQHALTPFVVYEGLLNAVARDIERDVLPMCLSEGLALTVWEAMGGGKFKTRIEKSQADGRPFYDLAGKGLEAYEAAGLVLERIAKRKDTNPMAIALRYVTLKAPYIFPIIGGRKIENLKSNIAALDIDLTEDEMEEIEAASPVSLGYPHVVLAGRDDQHVGPTNPTFIAMWSSGFEGVEMPKISDTGTEDRKTLRERVSRLEERLDAIQDGSKSDFPSSSLTVAGHEDPLPASRDSQGEDGLVMDPGKHMAPLIAVLQGSNLLSDPSGSYLPLLHLQDPHGGNDAGRSTALGATKALRICEALRNTLPPYDELLFLLSKGGQWWDHWNQKTFGDTIQHETLTEYAIRVYGENSPTDLGMLVSAFARHTDIDPLRLMSVIDQVVIGDDSYAGTVTGLVLIAFQTKNYLDAGQPRRAFLCNRRGLNLCQLMNLHRKYESKPQLGALWWTLFQGDRFLSILLGVPYGMKNDQFSINPKSTGGIVAQPFVIRMGLMTGKVIDHTQTIPSPPFSRVIDLDDELENLAASKGPRWWDCSLPTESHAVADFRTRLVEHCVFFLSKMYLHLPCILKPRSSHLYSVSRKTGLDSTRQLISRYHALRTPVNGESVFDCKTLDFIGFMASVVLVVGISHEHSSGSPSTSSDWQLVNTTVSLLGQLAEEYNCTIAEQCYNSLTRLISLCKAQDSDIDSVPARFAIPYFGILHVTANTNSALRTHQNPSLHETAQPSTNVGAHPAPRSQGGFGTMSATLQADLPTIEYQGLYSMESNPNWMMDAPGLYTESFSSMMDLDQDWDTFLYPELGAN